VELSPEQQLVEYKKEMANLKTKIAKIEAELPQEEEKARPVMVLPIEAMDFESFIEVPGEITSKENISVFADMPGNITSLTIREGQYVSKGQTIATQDASTIRSQIGQLNANLRLAQTTYEKQKRLWDQNIGSEIQVLQARTQVEALQEQIKSIESQISKYTVRSPISGIVDEVFINQGEAANGPIARIVNLARVQMEANLSEEFIGKVKRGDRVTILLDNLEEERSARVSSVGQVIDPATRTFKVEVNLSNGSRRLKPNMSANMRIITEQLKDTVVIPMQYVQQDATNNFVYAVEKDGENEFAVLRKIETGSIFEDLAVVESGLTIGDLLIVEGQRDVVDSTKVLSMNIEIEEDIEETN